MKRAPALLLALVLAAAATLAAQQPPRQTFRFEIDVAPELFPPDIVPRSLDGRVLLIVSSDRSQEPRFQVGRGLNSQLLFGIDVEGLKPEPSSSFVLQQREVYDSFGRRSVIPVRTYQERKGFILQPRFVFIDGRTGAILYSETFHEEILYPAQQSVPALSTYFELMDRVMPSFLSTLSAQKIRGTRVLLK